MAYKKIWLGIPVVALVWGMTVLGCDTGGDPQGEKGDVPLPASSGNNTLSEKVYFEEREKITFSATGDGAESGTYVVTTLDNGIYEAGDEFTFTTEIETGSYSWDENSQTVTLKPEKAIWDKRGSSSGGTGTIEIEIDYGPLVDRAAYRNDLQAEWNKMAAGMPQAEISAELSSMGFSSITDYVNYIVDEAFSNRSYTYSFADEDETVLFLEAVLPDNKGANELGDQTYYDYYDESREYVFTASDYTFTGYGTTITGSYAYDSSKKSVWLQPKTIDGKTRLAYYESQTADSRFPDDNAARSSETNYAFNSRNQNYDSEYNTIGFSGSTSGSGSTGTYNLSWGVTNTSYSTVRSTIYEQDWDVRESTSDWALATGSDATVIYNWVTDNIEFQDSGTFSGSLADCFNFSNDGISAPRGLKTVSKINSRNVPLAGVFDGGSYTVLFYLTKK